MTALKPIPKRQRGRWQRIAVLAAAAGIVLSLVVAAPASAAIKTGTLGCGSNYGWLTATAYVYSSHVPPGSQTKFVSTSGGTYTLVATYTNGLPKPGGGAWGVEGTTSASGTPSCKSYG